MTKPGPIAKDETMHGHIALCIKAMELAEKRLAELTEHREVEDWPESVERIAPFLTEHSVAMRRLRGELLTFQKVIEA